LKVRIYKCKSRNKKVICTAITTKEDELVKCNIQFHSQSSPSITATRFTGNVQHFQRNHFSICQFVTGINRTRKWNSAAVKCNEHTRRGQTVFVNALNQLHRIKARQLDQAVTNRCNASLYQQPAVKLGNVSCRWKYQRRRVSHGLYSWIDKKLAGLQNKKLMKNYYHSWI
jgi:predicted phosphohydrolase